MPRGVNQGGPDDELVAKVKDIRELVAESRLLRQFPDGHKIEDDEHDLVVRQVAATKRLEAEYPEIIPDLLRTIDDLKRKLGVAEGALKPFAAAGKLFTSGIHNGGLEKVQAFPTPQEWRIAAGFYRGPSVSPFEGEKLRAALSDSPIDKGGE